MPGVWCETAGGGLDGTELRGRLCAAGYTAEALARQLGIRFPDDIGPLNHAATALRIEAERSALSVLARLFFLETEVEERAAARLLPVQMLARCGLVLRRAGKVRARLRIDPVGERYFLADCRFCRPFRAALDLPAGDMVYPPSADSLMLAGAVVPREGGDVLDLCTGSGVQAVALASSARRVVGVDISARAAALARQNARLNEAGNVELRRGDLYAPVRGERFDLIVANPPFVPGPSRGPSYHSGGARGERVLARVLAGLEDHLRPDGTAYTISHLAIGRGRSVADVVRPWLRGFGGRVLVLLLERGTPIDLAAAQSLFALDRGLRSYEGELRRWVEYLRRHGVSEIFLLLAVAERSGRPDLQVQEAYPRTLPLPLSKPPEQLVREWLGGSAAAARQ